MRWACSRRHAQADQAVLHHLQHAARQEGLHREGDQPAHLHLRERRRVWAYGFVALSTYSYMILQLIFKLMYSILYTENTVQLL